MSGKNSPAKRARTGFERSEAGGRQPFMPRVSHDPCLLMLPFRFAQSEANAAAFVGRVTTPFIKRLIIVR
jgi:hypothetical protein